MDGQARNATLVTLASVMMVPWSVVTTNSYVLISVPQIAFRPSAPAGGLVVRTVLTEGYKDNKIFIGNAHEKSVQYVG